MSGQTDKKQINNKHSSFSTHYTKDTISVPGKNTVTMKIVVNWKHAKFYWNNLTLQQTGFLLLFPINGHSRLVDYSATFRASKQKRRKKKKRLIRV